MKWLIYGAHGWIGSYICDHIRSNYPDINLFLPHTRVDDIDAIKGELDEVRPDNVICLVGRTSGPGCNQY